MSRGKRRVPARLVDTVKTAIQGAAMLRREDVAMLEASLREHLRLLQVGIQPALQWRSMADALNIAETLADLGICSDDESRVVIERGQAVLAALAQRVGAAGTWAMRHDERAALDEALDRHAVQVGLCSLAEYEQAIRITMRRVEGARQGNAARGTVVVELPR